MYVLLHLLICTALRAYIIVVEALYKILLLLKVAALAWRHAIFDASLQRAVYRSLETNID